MEIEELKATWTNQKTIGYSQEELDSIYHIKQSHSLNILKSGLSWDLGVAIFITIAFIVFLQVLDFKESNFWSICMGVFALQHILFYRFQVYLLRKYSVFSKDVGQSITDTIGKIRGLLWFYRLWPATLTILLSVLYFGLYRPQIHLWLMLLIVTFLAGAIAILSNIISAVLVRKQLSRLESLKEELLKLRD